MFDQLPETPLTSDRPTVAQIARVFLAHQGHCLPTMIEMLAGPKARNAVFDLLEGVAARSLSDRQIIKEFDKILAVLDLRHVGDPSRLEAALFSEIDPADGIVHDICAMTEAVQNAVSGFRAAQGRVAR